MKAVYLLVFSLSISFITSSCSKNDNNIENIRYYNFSSSKEKQNDSLINISKIAVFDNDLKYLVKHKENDSLYESFFEMNNVKYKLSNLFENSKHSFEYSIMPHYNDSLLVAKQFKLKKEGFNILLIKAENPDCNGSHCHTYFLHLLIYNQNEIIDNKVFLFNSINYDFTHFNIKHEETYKIMYHDKLIHEIKNIK